MLTNIDEIKGVAENMDNAKLVEYYRRYAIKEWNAYINKSNKKADFDRILEALEDEILARLEKSC